MLKLFQHVGRVGFQAKALARIATFSSAAKTVKVKYVVQGTTMEKTVDAPIGENLWEIAQKNDIPLEGACEGNCACGTCHVILENNLFKKIPQAKDEEEDLLQVAFGRKPSSRLGCQVKVNEEFEGTTVTVPSQTRNIDVKKF